MTVHTVLQTGSHVAQATLGLAMQSKLIFLQLPPGALMTDEHLDGQPRFVSHGEGPFIKCPVLQ